MLGKAVENCMHTKIVYVDMDNVLVDFPSGIANLSAGVRTKFEGNYDEVPGIFSLMRPMPGAIEGFRGCSSASGHASP